MSSHKYRYFLLLAVVGAIIVSVLFVARPKRHLTLAQRGAEAYLAGDYKTAAKIKKQGLANRPADPADKFDLAMTLKHAGQKEEALTLFRELEMSNIDPYDKAAKREIDALQSSLRAEVNSR